MSYLLFNSRNAVLINFQFYPFSLALRNASQIFQQTSNIHAIFRTNCSICQKMDASYIKSSYP